MSSKVLVIRSTSTGAGISGLSLSLRIAPYTSDLFTASEVSGKAGAYQFVVDKCYPAVKLFQDGVEDKSFGGDNGTDLFVDSDIVHKTGDESISGFKTFNSPVAVPAPTEGEHSINKDYADTNYVDLVSNQSIDGNKTFIDPVVVPAPTLASHALNRDSADLRYRLSEKAVLVDSNLSSDVAGVKYAKIQDAVNYAQTQSPSATNRYTILIVPSKNVNGYSENITLQPYVDLVGLGIVKISGTLSGGNVNSWLNNIFLSYDGNLSVNSIRGFNSFFKCYQSTPNGGYTLTVQSSLLIQCFLVATAGSDPKIVSGGNNIFVNCSANKFSGLASSDKGTIHDLMDSTITL